MLRPSRDLNRPQPLIPIVSPTMAKYLGDLGIATTINRPPDRGINGFIMDYGTAPITLQERDRMAKSLMVDKIFLGDCVEQMRHFPDDSVDITITSPPYNVGKTTRGNLYTTYKDDLTMDEYTEWLIEIGMELLRITKHYTFFNVQILTDNKMAIVDFIHFFRGNLKDIFIWAKTPIPQIASGKLATGYELIIILGNDSRMIYDHRNFPSNGFVPNIERWIQQGSDRSQSHGATFPIKMPKFFIEQFSKPDELVFDPFMGTGTTALAAIELGRKYCGTELDPEYYELCNKRIEERKQDFEFTLNFKS